MFASRARYALRAALWLADRYPRFASAHRVAEGLAASPKFMESILTDLSHQGLLVSQRGRAGGYRLARPPASVSVLDIVNASGVRLWSHECSPDSPACQGCDRVATCKVRLLLADCRDALEASLAAQTLDGLRPPPGAARPPLQPPS